MLKSLLKSFHLYSELEKTEKELFDMDAEASGISPSDRNRERQQFIAEKMFMHPRFVQIRQESLEIMQSTINPKTFWGRYGDILHTFEMDFSGGVPGGVLEAATEERKAQFRKEMEPVIKDFIDRCISRGKADVLAESMEIHWDKLTPELQEYFEKKINIVIR